MREQEQNESGDNGSKGWSPYMQVLAQSVLKQRGIGKMYASEHGVLGDTRVHRGSARTEPSNPSQEPWSHFRDPCQKLSASHCWSGATLGPETVGVEIGAVQGITWKRWPRREGNASESGSLVLGLRKEQSFYRLLLRRQHLQKARKGEER